MKEKKERLQAGNEPVLAWFSKHARILPWRENPEAYRVWISEIMLQQTRVEAVKPYYERFLAVCPNPKALAEIEDDRLMKLWEGLGYYNRARNLKKTAGILCESYQGQLPASYEALLTLPGIGSYTAGAIASIAYGIAVPAVDGNVLRVISRVLFSHEDITKASVKKEMEQLLRETMPKEQAGAYNQALMEIGAMVCIPNGSPKCEECPLASLCLAYQSHAEQEVPVKTPKKARKIQKRTILVLKDKSQVLLHKREETGLLAGLYELPNFDGTLTKEALLAVSGIECEQVLSVEKLPSAKHIFSHIEWHMDGYLVQVEDVPKATLFLQEKAQGFLTVQKQNMNADYVLPSAFRAYRRWLA